MTQGSNNLHFFYDAQGKPAIVVFNGIPYSYVKNQQGDIVAILDSNKNVVVSYVYDVWGRPIRKEGSLASTLGTVQPFRYRGYVYDEETGLYYLNSRFYKSENCRFINRDSQLDALSQLVRVNLFTYCGNSPITSFDPDGHKTTLSNSNIPDNYRYDDSVSINCYAYAFGLEHGANPGDYSVSVWAMLKYWLFGGKAPTLMPGDDIETAAQFVMRDMKAHNRTVRRINSPSEFDTSEYVVAMKVTLPRSDGQYDYHFAVLLSDGTWADKPGSTPSRWNILDGTAATWDRGVDGMEGAIEDFYNSPSVYFAVEKGS